MAIIAKPDWVTPQILQQALSPATPGQAFQGQINSAVGSGQSALASGNVAQQTQGADINLKKATANVADKTQDAKITQATSDATVAQNLAEQLAFMSDTQQNFATAAKTHGGKVPPSYYNEVLGEASQFNISNKDFEDKFNNYVDHSHEIAYNTADGMVAQGAYAATKRQIQAEIDNYNSIPDSQKGVISESSVSDIPVIGQLIAPQAYSYEKNRSGLATELKSIVGAGAGSGLRVTQTELDNWSNLLPSPKNTDAVNKKNIEELNSQLKSTFGVDIGLDPQYLPQSSGQGNGKNMKIGSYSVEVSP